IEQEEAAEILLFQLAIENANADCKRAIEPIRNSAKTIADLIKACQNVGSEQHKAEMLAAALAQQMIVAQTALRCFRCGQEGHMKRNCPQTKGLRQNAQRTPTQLCLKCGKGYHWSNQCRSKFDNQGNPMQGNRKRGARPGAPR
ncbi:GAK5 protein, partial [Chunga burmeisteri]|nr:GAK5 protein [Chunga burmeisteri]